MGMTGLVDIEKCYQYSNQNVEDLGQQGSLVKVTIFQKVLLIIVQNTYKWFRNFVLTLIFFRSYLGLSRMLSGQLCKMSTETFENFAYEEVDCEGYQLRQKDTTFYEAEIIESFVFSMVWLTLKGVVAGDCELTEHVYDETHIDEELGCQRCLS